MAEQETPVIPNFEREGGSADLADTASRMEFEETGEDTAGLEDGDQREGADASTETVEGEERDTYEERFKGLQGAYQRVVEQYRQQQQQWEQERGYLEQRQREYEEYLLQEQLQQLPPEQRMPEMARYRQIQALQRQERMLQEQQARTEIAAREIVKSTLAQRYGVPAADLDRFRDPESMELFAQRVAEIRRTAGRQTRRVQRQDAFEGSSTGGAAVPKARDLDSAEHAFRQDAIRRLGHML